MGEAHERSELALDGFRETPIIVAGGSGSALLPANTKELMVRMGHDSQRAALIYLHSTDKRQRALADAVGKAARAELAKSKKPRTTDRSGTRKARRRDDLSET